MTWVECWGTYAATGPYNNVVMGGSPANSMYGLDLTTAKIEGNYGNGVEFSYNSSNNTVGVHINLIGYACDSNFQYIPNQHYVVGNFTYDWYCDFYYSTDGGHNYHLIKTDKVASHASTQTLCYSVGWSASNVNYITTLSLPQNFTHVKIEVRGDEPAQRHQNIYTREIVIQSFKPWAIRKSNQFKSLDVSSGFYKIRKSNNWVDKSEMLLSDINRDNAGTARIRKNGTFKGQNKIGN